MVIKKGVKRLSALVFVLVFALTLVSASQIKINEFVVDPQTDWNGNNATGSTDEWVELYNAGPEEVDLTGWTLALTDTTPENETLEGNISSNGYLVILNPVGAQNNDGMIVLYNELGEEIDSVTYGDFDDGYLENNAVDGNANNETDECLARFPNGYDTGNDLEDFRKQECSFESHNGARDPVCGNGVLERNEECDDGNLRNRDGCNSLCEVERSSGNGIGGSIGIEDFKPIVWKCSEGFLIDEEIQPWRITGDGDELYERSNNYLFEGESYFVDVVVWDKNKIQDVVVDLVLGEDKGDVDYNINCVPTGSPILREFSLCNARIDEEEVEEFDQETMQAYTCSITALDSEHMYGKYWFSVQADDGNSVGEYDEVQPLWVNPIIDLDIDGGLDFEDVRPGTSSYSQVLVENVAEGGVALDMFITGHDWPAMDTDMGRCYDPVSKQLVNYLSLGAFRYYAENGAYSTRLDQEVDTGYSSVTRDCDQEGYCNINKQINEGFEEAMFDDAEIIQAGGDVVAGEGYRANVLTPGSSIALTFRLDLPEPCYGEFQPHEDLSIMLWAEAI